MDLTVVFVDMVWEICEKDLPVLLRHEGTIITRRSDPK